jgi:hypothetical protein
MKRLFVLVAMVLMTAGLLWGRDYKHSLGLVAGSFSGLSYKVLLAESLAFQADLGVGVMATTGELSRSAVVIKFDGSELDGWKEKYRACGSLWTLQVSPNFMWHKVLAEKQECNIAFTLGGGISVGYSQIINSPTVSSGTLFHINKSGLVSEGIEIEEEVINGTLDDDLGKFAVNALVGVEIVLKNAPITIGFDVRPGYGMLFMGRDKAERDAYNALVKEHWDNGELYSATLYSYQYFDWTVSASIRYTF